MSSFNICGVRIEVPIGTTWTDDGALIFPDGEIIPVSRLVDMVNDGWVGRMSF